MRRCFTLYVIREIQIKTKIRYHYLPSRVARVRNSNQCSKCWWGCGTTGTHIHFRWEYKMIWPLWTTVWWFLTKVNIFLSYHPATAFLGIYPKEVKIYVYTKTCIWMSIAALLIIVQIWKKPRCPSLGEWINRLLYKCRYWNLIQC